jgi:hypothetical protein
MGRLLRWGAGAVAALLCAIVIQPAWAQQSKATTHPAAPQAEEKSATDIPELVDITAKTGIHFDHLSSTENKYIVESMSGGVALIDYDRDGWPVSSSPTRPT